jgi:ClpP class serine protease
MDDEQDQDFKTAIKIDRFKLDTECEEFASVFHHWSEEAANARGLVDRLKEQLELLEAQKELHYRAKPPEGVKVTEAVISALVIADNEVQALQKQLADARDQYYTLSAGEKALDHKGKQLDNLRHLWIAGYYATPGGRKPVDDAADAARKGLHRRTSQEDHE